MLLSYFLYILLCGDGSFYTGITTDLKQRFLDHKAGKGGAYTRSHKPVKFVYQETYGSRSNALKREAQIKGWPRAKKLQILKLVF